MNRIPPSFDMPRHVEPDVPVPTHPPYEEPMEEDIYLPNGRRIKAGSREDKATWWTCTRCGVSRPSVGTDDKGRKVCLPHGAVKGNPGIARVRLTTPPWWRRVWQWILRGGT